MPFQYEWDAENNILINFYTGEVSLEEAKQTYVEAAPFFENSTGVIHNIINLTNGYFAPDIKVTTFTNLPESIAYAEKYRERIGWSLYLGHKDNPLYQMITSINMQKNNLRMRWLDTMDDAYQFLYDNGMIESPKNPYGDR